MVDVRTCNFCGEVIEPGTGKMFIRKDGTIFFFCSSKCQNNSKLGRVPRRVRWTQAGRKALGKK
jgi:large subunit ribosomal protein L24e